MTYEELTAQIFSLPAQQREDAAEKLLELYTEDDKDLVEAYIYEAITAADDETKVFLL